MFIKSPIVDTGVIRFESSLYEYSQYCNVLIIDNGYGEVTPNIYCVFEPMDKSVLHPISENEKKYELSFVGSMYENERKFFLEKFKESKINFVQFGGKENGETPLEYADWAKIHRESKIEFCFNGNPFLGARKGRVWEIAACGNFMLCTVPDVYQYYKGSWFVENTHFVSFNERNYKDKINYYLNNPDKRIAIAKNMHQLYLEKYTEDIWWSNLFKYSKDK
jgi:spore maturation protein CgeB